MNSTNLKHILTYLPNKYSFVFAYGSRVKLQANKQVATGDMIDLIVAVDEPTEFHKENLAMNPTHYSFVRRFGAKVIAGIQQNFGAKVYYNTLVPIDDGANLIKYGVIKTQHLINDLLDWESLYISGRLHKPVEVIYGPDSEVLSKALKLNLQNAVHTALLLLEETFTEEQLYMTISHLSYGGDFRMIVGEDKNKVSNIVKPQISNFRQLYQPYMTSDPMQRLVHWNPNSQTFNQDSSSKVVLHHLNLLPKNVQQQLYILYSKNGRSRDLDDVLLAISKSYDVSKNVSDATANIVWSSSWSQSLKGITTGGVVKSFKYSFRKLTKMYHSLTGN